MLPAGVYFSPRMVWAAFLADIDQILGQRTDDAVAARVDLADLAPVLQGGFDHTAGGGIDDRGDPAGLGIEGIARRA